MHEIWKPIPGYTLYEVSNFGRVRSLDRVIIQTDGRKRISAGRILQGGRNARSGYALVILSEANRKKTVNVHSLVMKAFVGPRPDGTEICHNDGNPRNNRLDNLRYDTRAANSADSERHGTRAKGERSGVATLTENQVREIRRLRKAGVKQRVLAAQFGVSGSHISAIANRKWWAWLHD